MARKLGLLALDGATWLFCVACYWAYLKLPLSYDAGLKLLPWCGRYAYSTSWADFRETCAWNRAGQPRDWDWSARL
mgnify:CR=1 FL=1